MKGIFLMSINIKSALFALIFVLSAGAWAKDKQKSFSLYDSVVATRPFYKKGNKIQPGEKLTIISVSKDKVTLRRSRSDKTIVVDTAYFESMDVVRYMPPAPPSAEHGHGEAAPELEGPQEAYADPNE